MKLTSGSKHWATLLLLIAVIIVIHWKDSARKRQESKLPVEAVAARKTLA
jgi:cytochrome b561